MTVPFGLIIQCNFRSIVDFEKACQSIGSKPNTWIWLSGDINIIQPYLDKINSTIEKQQIQIITQSETLIKAGLQANALMTDNYEHIPNTKKNHPTILIGFVAKDLADSKNTELFKGDFVCLGPIDEIGEVPYITLVPEKPDYEWMFIDITIPVIGFGKIERKNLESFTKTVDLSGFVCSESDYQKHIQSELRFVSK